MELADGVGGQKDFNVQQEIDHQQSTRNSLTHETGQRKAPEDEERAAGIQEVVLTGVHLGGYGSDLGTDLRALIAAVLADTDMPRVRVGSLEPWDLPPGFWDLFADRRLIPHLHLPLQSGADSVLRRMARPCRAADFRALAGEARAAVPDLKLTTDVIVGFPGETEAEWRRPARAL